MGLHGHTRMILESEILAVQSISKTGQECARNLGVHFNTYKKYADQYGIYGRCLNRTGKGTKKIRNPYKATQPIDEILQNKYPNTNHYSVLKKLVRANLKKHECDVCGYREKRITDDVIPLILCFKDTDRQNFSLDNLEICCFNCAHNMHDAVIVKKPKSMQKKTGRKKCISITPPTTT